MTGYIFVCILILISQSECSREVTLSCGNDEELERGFPGVPGKRGVKGEKGEPGNGPVEAEGQKCECVDYGDVVRRLEEKVLQLETRLNDTNRDDEGGEEDTVSAVSEVNTVASRRDCNDLADQGFTSSGVYNITVGERIVSVYCDLETAGGKWLIFQRRINGQVDFFRPWRNYVNGFGNVHHEFWLGLENIHLITSSSSYKLRVDLEDWEGNRAYAIYSTFVIGNAMTKYVLRVGEYSGTAGNSLHLHHNHAFTTRDRDNDRHSTIQCADFRKGGWWYTNCAFTNLNGRYLRGGVIDLTGITWRAWKNNLYSAKRAEMKISRN